MACLLHHHRRSHPLGETLRALFRVPQFGFQFRTESHELVDLGDDALLFSQRGDCKRELFQVLGLKAARTVG